MSMQIGWILKNKYEANYVINPNMGIIQALIR